MEKLGITSVEQLRERNPDELAKNLPTISSKKINIIIVELYSGKYKNNGEYMGYIAKIVINNLILKN